LNSANRDLFYGKNGYLPGSRKESQKVSIGAAPPPVGSVHVNTPPLHGILSEEQWQKRITDVDRRALPPRLPWLPVYVDDTGEGAWTLDGLGSVRSLVGAGEPLRQRTGDAVAVHASAQAGVPLVDRPRHRVNGPVSRAASVRERTGPVSPAVGRIRAQLAALPRRDRSAPSAASTLRVNTPSAGTSSRLRRPGDPMTRRSRAPCRR
jgi:hypothetical protein